MIIKQIVHNADGHVIAPTVAEIQAAVRANAGNPNAPLSFEPGYIHAFFVGHANPIEHARRVNLFQGRVANQLDAIFMYFESDYPMPLPYAKLGVYMVPETAPVRATAHRRELLAQSLGLNQVGAR